jgi:16S rRNA (guanine527-N7)-methyltransferase
LPFLRVEGIFIAQKTRNDEELTEAETAIKELGGIIRETIPVRIEGLEERQLVIIEKISKTSEKYPRRVGVPSRRPL